MKQSLVEIFSEIGHFGSDIGCNDKGGTHSYLESYDKLFDPYRNGCSFLEIGLAQGDSLRLWDRYFENSKITGVDITVVFTPGEYKNKVDVFQADATKPEFLDLISNETFDIIVDDGSHMHQDQVATFNLLKHKMNKGGIYVIEDILNFELAWPDLKAIHDDIEVIDLRKVKGRFDDILLVYKF